MTPHGALTHLADTTKFSPKRKISYGFRSPYGDVRHPATVEVDYCALRAATGLDCPCKRDIMRETLRRG
jgi:hypothetical protein